MDVLVVGSAVIGAALAWNGHVYALLCVRADRVRTSNAAPGRTDGGRVRRLGWWVVTLLLGVVALSCVHLWVYGAYSDTTRATPLQPLSGAVRFGV